MLKYQCSNFKVQCSILKVHIYKFINLCKMCMAKCLQLFLLLLFNVQWSIYNDRYTMFNIHFSMFKVKFSMTKFQCPTFNFQCSMFKSYFILFHVFQFFLFMHLNCNLFESSSSKLWECIKHFVQI